MRFLRDVSLKGKLMVIIMSTSSVALLLACAAFVIYEVVLFRRDVVRDLTTVYLKSDLLELNTRLQHYAKIVGVVLLVSISVAWLLSLRLQRVVSRPILHLAKTTRVVSADKNYALRAVKQSEDELGEL